MNDHPAECLCARCERVRPMPGSATELVRHLRGQLHDAVVELERVRARLRESAAPVVLAKLTAERDEARSEVEKLTHQFEGTRRWYATPPHERERLQDKAIAGLLAELEVMTTRATKLGAQVVQLSDEDFTWALAGPRARRAPPARSAGPHHQPPGRNDPMSLGDDFIEKLAELVATRVATKLGTMPGVTYTTAKTGPFVPGKSRAWMLKNVKTMPGARKAGATWMISKEDFEAWARALDAAKVRPVSGSVDELADSFLDRAGYRATKGAA